MRELTGRHVLGITVASFGLIIGVNLLMAYQAITTFPGLEVQNSYVASQTWDAERAAQNALNWRLVPVYDPLAQTLTLAFTDTDNLPIEVSGLNVLLGRPTEARDDRRPDFVRQVGVYVAQADLRPGKWMLHVEAVAKDGTLFRQRIDLFVKG